MARVCRGLCNDPEYFSKPKLSYSKGSKCNVCKVWVKQPTHIPIDFHIAATNEGNREHYYDITGKQAEVLILIPVKQLAWCTRNQEGKFVKMIKELELDVECRCCHSICRGSPYSKTDERKAVKKERITIEKVGALGVIPVFKEVKYVKPDLPVRLQDAKKYAKKYPIKPGRPTGPDKNKERVDQIVNIIKITKGTMWEKTLEDEDFTPLHLRNKVKRKLDKENEGKEESNVT